MVDVQTAIIALAGLTGGFIVTVITTTWRSATFMAKLEARAERAEEERKRLEEKQEELDEKTSKLTEFDDLKRRVATAEENFGEVPKLGGRVLALEQAVKFSGEVRKYTMAAAFGHPTPPHQLPTTRVRPGSRPDPREIIDITEEDPTSEEDDS